MIFKQLRKLICKKLRKKKKSLKPRSLMWCGKMITHQFQIANALSRRSKLSKKQKAKKKGKGLNKKRKQKF